MSFFDLVGNYHDKANLSKKSYHQQRLALFNKEIMVLHMRYVIMIIGTTALQKLPVTARHIVLYWILGGSFVYIQPSISSSKMATYTVNKKRMIKGMIEVIYLYKVFSLYIIRDYCTLKSQVLYSHYQLKDTDPLHVNH